MRFSSVSSPWPAARPSLASGSQLRCRDSCIGRAWAALSLVSLAGCTGLFDIPDNPRLVASPDASMPGIRTEPPLANDSMLPPAGDAPESELEGTASESPSLVAPEMSDGDGQIIEEERIDAGSPAFDAGGPVPDAAPPIPPPVPRCSEPAILGPNGRCFVVTNTLLTWSGARLACRARGPGWDLVAIPDDAVNQFMGQLGAGEAWIGASDGDDEGLWVWVGDGTPFWIGNGTTGSAPGAAFENWNSDEPNGGNNSDCARLVFNTNAAPHPPPAWADLECFELRRSVCDGPPL